MVNLDIDYWNIFDFEFSSFLLLYIRRIFLCLNLVFYSYELLLFIHGIF